MQDLRRLLTRASRMVSRPYRTEVGKWELTPSQAGALMAISHNPGSTLGQLAQETGTDLASASTKIDKLMSAGLVRRDTDPSDRRRAILHLTQKAEAIVTEIEEAQHAASDELRRVLGEEKATVLADILTELLDKWEATEEEAASSRAVRP